MIYIYYCLYCVIILKQYNIIIIIMGSHGGGEIGTRARITDIFVGQYNTDISVTLPIQQHDHT